MKPTKDKSSMPDEVYFVNGILYNTFIPDDGHGAYIKKDKTATINAQLDDVIYLLENFSHYDALTKLKEMRGQNDK
jgi:hypothetical protein